MREHMQLAPLNASHVRSHSSFPIDNVVLKFQKAKLRLSSFFLSLSLCQELILV